MKNIRVLVLSAFALAGCAASQTTNPSASAPHSPEHARGEADPVKGPGMMGGKGMMGHMAGMCPLAVPATTVRSEETEGGASLTFVTSGDVAELRRRVAAMAKMHADGKGCPMMKAHEPANTPPATPSEHDAHHPPTGG